MTLTLSIKLLRVVFLLGLAIYLLVPSAPWKKAGAVAAGIVAVILAYLVFAGRF